MATFLYSAMSRTGERVSGEIEAATRALACRRLDLQDLQPFLLQPKEADPQEKILGMTREPDGPISVLTRSQVIAFTEELGDLLDAGLRLEPALGIIEKRREFSGLKPVASALRQRVREGVSFSVALRETQAGFDELYCSLVAAGEASGSLGVILRRHTLYLAAMRELQGRVLTALIYPGFILLTGIVLLVVFMTVLVPQLTSLLARTEHALPLTLRLLVGGSDFFTQGWPWLAALPLIGVTGLWLVRRSPAGRQWWDEFEMKLPLVGPVLAHRFFAQFAQTMATLLRNGIPLLNGLKLAGAATPNSHVRGLITRVTEMLAEGGTLTRALGRVGHFPPVLIDMVGVGEQTGDLASALEKVAKRYDKELNTRIQRITAMIQPVVIILMAILVGFIAFAIITGISQAVSGLHVRM